MDDSVIKVLRRNGSWSNVDKGETTNSIKKDMVEDTFLDKNFGVLAEEIKKRMRKRTLGKGQNIEFNINNNDQDFNQSENSAVKIKLLPYLRSIEKLTGQRDNFLKKIDLIDSELEMVRNEIINIKNVYERNLNELKSNINFFDQSIDLIDKIKGDKKK